MNKVGQKASRFFIKTTLAAITAVALYSAASTAIAHENSSSPWASWPKSPPEPLSQASNSLSTTAQPLKRMSPYRLIIAKDTTKDTTKLQYPIKEETDMNTRFRSPLYMKTPSNIKTELVYNPITKTYELTNKIGRYNYQKPQGMTLDQYSSYDMQNSLQNYWKQKVQADRASKTSGGSQGFTSFLSPKWNIPIEGVDKIFGSNVIDIKPQGKAELIMGVNISKIENPILPKNMQRHISFDFDEKIQMGVTGAIGDKLKVGINYNTEATFDFENTQKLGYTGKEDEIIKNIEVGNVSMPLTGTLISGGSALFGVKTELQFGKLNVTSVFSRQQGESQVIEVKKGAQTSNFKINADEYEANRHFFLSQEFRDNYESALAELPVINSGYNIVKLEVWVTNKSKNFDQSRNILCFQDLGEGRNRTTNEANFDGPETFIRPQNGLIENKNNDLYRVITSMKDQIRVFSNISGTLSGISDLKPTRDYEKIEQARLLKTGEYSFNPKLGYISLNQALNSDEILAVSYQYTYNGTTYKVGELTTDLASPNTLVTKMLKSTNLNPRFKAWKLMMKNIYSMNAYQVNSNNFTLSIKYRNAATGTPISYIPAGEIDKKLLLRVLNLDQLNSQQERHADGYFDFIDGYTINATNGRIIFPMLEPFGSYIKEKITGGNAAKNGIAEPYVFQELYDSTQTKAKQYAEKNKYFLEGSYQSASGSEINLNASNVSQGSVKVTANGAILQENTDYIVDYSLGRVTILNKALLESGTPIQISLENRPLFNMGTKTFLGTHLDYKFSDKFIIGGTLLHLSERPLTSKINVGEEPISNTIWGLNGTYTTNLPWLTKMLDKSGIVKTKEMSTITFSGEFAQLVPGHNRLIGANGVSYIDDFEASKTSFDLMSPSAWTLASVPGGQKNEFKEAALSNDLTYGFNRAKLAWYSINPDIQRGVSGTLPSYINKDSISSPLVRAVYAQDLWPKKDTYNGIKEIIRTLDLSFYPSERGPYNYETDAVSGISAGINAQGYLNNPKSRWGGIMRRINQYSDFEALNVEYIEFWIMDPFYKSSKKTGGKLYFNLGNISEDILKDSRKAFEQGLPKTDTPTQVDSTQWGRLPLVQSYVSSFDNNSVALQDIGYDGLKDADEQSFFSLSNPVFGQKDPKKYGFMDKIRQYDNTAPQIAKVLKDPSSDDYHFYKGDDYDAQKAGILERYKDFNGVEGNSTPSIAASGKPDWEDINEDNTLSENENYFQYSVDINKNNLEIGKNNIVDIIEDIQTRINGVQDTARWIQFKIPLREGYTKIGDIEDFKSIRFMRMYLKGFEENITLRFAKLDLVKSEWRKYTNTLLEGAETTNGKQPEDASFEVSAVNIEENGSKKPVNYILPPGITRVIDPTQPQLRQLNEQAMVLKTYDLEDGDARAAYKTTSLDARQYKKMQMFIHGEALPNVRLKDNDLSVFVRIGSDFLENYYEYEIPLKLTIQGEYVDNDANRLKVWPEENNLELELAVLKEAKLTRNKAMRTPGSLVSLATPFIVTKGSKRIKVVGNPNLAAIKAMMIGVRNPKQGKSNSNPNDDGLSKSGEIWVNELRFTDYNDEGGWAANARINTKLADFATLTLAGNMSTPGWGSIEKKLNERQKEEIIQYDVSTQVEMGKVFPQRYGVKLPVFIGYSEGFSTPKYNPLDPDMDLKESLNGESQHYKDSIYNLVQDYTKRKSFNITNARITNPSGKEKGNTEAPSLLSISNFSTSYSFSEVFMRNITTEYNDAQSYAGSLAYNYVNAAPKNIMPFRNARILNNSYLALIRDFNFYYLPKQLSVRTDISRYYQEIQMRDISTEGAVIPASYKKDFLWNRTYDLKFDLSKNIKLDFSASNYARVDEPDGRISSDDKDYKLKRDTIWRNLLSGGRTTQYQHRINLTWNVPLNKIPMLAWINANLRYGGTYDWNIGPVVSDASRNLGNTLKNSNTKQATVAMNFQSLFSKLSFINQNNNKVKNNQTTNLPTKTVEYKSSGVKLKAFTRFTLRHKMGTKDVNLKVVDEYGKEIKGKYDNISDDKTEFFPERNSDAANIVATGKVTLKEGITSTLGRHALFALTSLNNIMITYTNNSSTSLPGYMPTTKILGLQNTTSSLAPGVPFILGMQEESFPQYASSHGWLSTDTLQTSPMAKMSNTTIKLTSSFEIFPNLRIDLDFFRNISSNTTQYWSSDGKGNFAWRNKMQKGIFSMSYNTIKTAFKKMDDVTYQSDAFDAFLSNRRTIAWRLADKRHGTNTDGSTYNKGSGEYPEGYSALNQDVMIPAFLAAYSGQDASKISLTNFPLIPLPNWSVRYDGLTRYEWTKNFIKSAMFTHSYKSTYNVDNYSSNINYNFDAIQADGFNYIRYELNNSFIPEFEVGSVSLNEQFVPLFGLDLTWKNNMTSRIEYKKSRLLTLGFSDNKLQETNSTEFIIGTGFKLNNIEFQISTGDGNKKRFKSDINIRGDFSIKDNYLISRNIDIDSTKNIPQIQSGQRVIAVKLTADYVLSKEFTLRLFYDQTINEPKVSSSFRTSNTKIGFSLTFNFIP